MDPNAKLTLRQAVQRSIRRRKQKSPFVYLAIAAVLLGILVLLKVNPIDPAPKAYDGIAGTGTLTATFTGNINCVGDGKTIDTDGYLAYFERTKELFANSDYLSVPVNDPILDDYVETYESGLSIKFADRYFNTDVVEALKEVGVNDATICHRDLFRYGSKGALETARALEYASIGVSGLEVISSSDAAVCTVFEKNGVKIIHVGIEASDDRMRDYQVYDMRTYNDQMNNIERDIAQLREQNPDAFIVITASWAEYYLLKPSAYMKDLCHLCIDSGADIVIGTGIQMVLSAEKYGDGYIFYGLGNLVSNEAYTMTQRGAVLNCVFAEDGSVTYELVPLSVINGRPQVTSSPIILRTLISDLGTDDYVSENGRIILK